MEEKPNDPTILSEQLEETEDALSFCDLAICSPTEWEKLSEQNESLSKASSPPSDSDGDMFEFFSEEWSNSSTYPLHQNIVFCGKILPLREPISHHNSIIQNPNTQKPKPKKRVFFRWKNSKLFRRNRAKNSVPLQECGHSKVGKGGEKCGFLVRKVSILSTAVKPRWQMVFGLARLPGETGLSDIRSRQRRRSPEALFRLGGDEKVKSGKRLWGLLRSLYCGGRHHYHRASTAVKT